MSFSSRFVFRFAPIFLLAAGVPSAAQEVPEPVRIPEDSVPAQLQRYQELQTRVTAVQSQALEASPELTERRAAIAEMVEARSYEVDPGLRQIIQTRMPELQRRVEVARAGGNTSVLRTVQAEFEALRQRARAAEGQALELPDVASTIAGFEDDLLEAMTAYDPDVGSALEELRALSARLELTLGGD
ncbi:MAG: hypothetical protein KJO11_10370 [Gemmatimonadetes bacterium]|nr:hypothetical protein [Gemmatimonadota bacterium]